MKSNTYLMKKKMNEEKENIYLISVNVNQNH